ncbi:uncharacterized protein LOC108167039 isoform X2 [Poecilia reticulata]|uniref:uncharacterized protein LOC108167039 isoform X2 n=1 Tax=Poecilia reticulata TaxID=8081 RepID=UPI0007E92F71|nr:PREDICTED: uncharacterized protein LOC108167039 isoform X2 [Poecilia reticulata]
MRASSLNPAALMELRKIPSHPSRREETASQRGGELQNRSRVSPPYRTLVLLTWEGRLGERAALILACRVRLLAPKSTTVLDFEKYGGSWRSHSRAGINALQPYLLCTWAAAARPAPLTTPLTGNMCCQLTAEPSCVLGYWWIKVCSVGKMGNRSPWGPAVGPSHPDSVPANQVLMCPNRRWAVRTDGGLTWKTCPRFRVQRPADDSQDASPGPRTALIASTGDTYVGTRR